MSRAALIAALDWQVELGADEAIGDAPVNRFALPERRAPQQPAAPAILRPDPLRDATALAEGAATLEALREALAGFEGSSLKAGARNCVFADGDPAARLMVIGEAPGRDEDRVGRPFVGRSGQLLERMLAAIGLSRTAPEPESAVYIANVLPWRPLGNRKPSGDEIALMLPFLRRHVALAQPEFLLLMGGTAAASVLNESAGILRLRGHWRRAEGFAPPALPTLHPAFLLRSPAMKRQAWRDLTQLRAALDGDTKDLPT